MSIDDANVTKRLFVGIEIPTSCHLSLNKNASALEDLGRGNRTRPENFHCTLAFIGHTDHQPQIEEALAKIRADRFSMEFGTPSCFVQNGRYIVYQSILPNEVLLRLQKQVVQQLHASMPKVEPFYTPHVTLLRNFRSQIPGLSVEQILKQNSAHFALPVAFPAESFHLYESKQVEGILRYIKLCDFPLA